MLYQHIWNHLAWCTNICLCLYLPNLVWTQSHVPSVDQIHYLGACVTRKENYDIIQISDFPHKQKQKLWKETPINARKRNTRYHGYLSVDLGSLFSWKIISIERFCKFQLMVTLTECKMFPVWKLLISQLPLWSVRPTGEYSATNHPTYFSSFFSACDKKEKDWFFFLF